MNTDDLVTVLSREDPRPSVFAPTTTVVIAAIAALVVVLIFSIVWLNPRTDLVAALVADNHMVLLKLGFTLAVVAAALPIVRDLATPGRGLGWGSIVVGVPFVVVVILALWELAALPVREWTHHVDHASWFECLWQIPALALPAFAILAIGMRRLAPTDLVRTGIYIGVLSGGIGGVGYVLHCHDDSLAFVAIAYTLAISEMAIVGALAGPRVLQWK